MYILLVCKLEFGSTRLWTIRSAPRSLATHTTVHSRLPRASGPLAAPWRRRTSIIRGDVGMGAYMLHRWLHASDTCLTVGAHTSRRTNAPIPKRSILIEGMLLRQVGGGESCVAGGRPSFCGGRSSLVGQ